VAVVFRSFFSLRRPPHSNASFSLGSDALLGAAFQRLGRLSAQFTSSPLLCPRDTTSPLFRLRGRASLILLPMHVRDLFLTPAGDSLMGPRPVSPVGRRGTSTEFSVALVFVAFALPPVGLGLCPFAVCLGGPFSPEHTESLVLLSALACSRPPKNPNLRFCPKFPLMLYHCPISHFTARFILAVLSVSVLGFKVSAVLEELSFPLPRP